MEITAKIYTILSLFVLLIPVIKLIITRTNPIDGKQQMKEFVELTYMINAENCRKNKVYRFFVISYAAWPITFLCVGLSIWFIQANAGNIYMMMFAVASLYSMYMSYSQYKGIRRHYYNTAAT